MLSNFHISSVFDAMSSLFTCVLWFLVFVTVHITVWDCCANSSRLGTVDNNLYKMSYTMESVREQKGLKIVHVNSRSVLQHFDELHGSFLDGSFEVIIFTESWLHSNCTDNLISVRGYSLYRLDRQTTNKSGSVKREVVS